jgi:hypothetical protein
MRRVFRYTYLSTGSNNVTLTNVNDGVKNDLGVDFVGNFNIAIHGAHIMASPPIGTALAPTNGVDLNVDLFDIENATPNNRVANYQDRAGPSGFANVRFAYPVNDRPTFSSSTPLTGVLITLDVVASSQVTIDFDITLTVAPTVNFLARIPELPVLSTNAPLPDNSIEKLKPPRLTTRAYPYGSGTL